MGQPAAQMAAEQHREYGSERAEYQQPARLFVVTSPENPQKNQQDPHEQTLKGTALELVDKLQIPGIITYHGNAIYQPYTELYHHEHQS